MVTACLQKKVVGHGIGVRTRSAETQSHWRGMRHTLKPSWWPFLGAEFQELKKSARHGHGGFWKQVLSKWEDMFRHIQNVNHLRVWNVMLKVMVKSIIPQRVTIHPRLSRTYPVWKREVPRLWKPLYAGKLRQDSWLPYHSHKTIVIGGRWSHFDVIQATVIREQINTPERGIPIGADTSPDAGKGNLVLPTSSGVQWTY